MKIKKTNQVLELVCAWVAAKGFVPLSPGYTAVLKDCEKVSGGDVVAHIYTVNTNALALVFLPDGVTLSIEGEISQVSNTARRACDRGAAAAAFLSAQQELKAA